MPKIETTLNAIHAHKPCVGGWKKLLKHLGKTKPDDEPLPLLTILESNGVEDALWCLRALGPEHHKFIVALACDMAEPALQFVLPGETRPAEAIMVARRWLNGAATIEEVRRAAVAADAAAAYAAYVAADAARVAADAVHIGGGADQVRILREAIARVEQEAGTLAAGCAGAHHER